MKDYQEEFLAYAIDIGVLRFGDFTLKSGRHSPYFFNTGRFQSGATLARLGQFYARAILASGCEFDMLYGPAYKGIPLVTATAIALAEHHQRDVAYAFNRKEVKRHAEGGVIVGAPLEGRVLIVDDVISAGLSVNESVTHIQDAAAEVAGVFIALNRMERGVEGRAAAATEVTQRYGFPVHSIVTLDTLIHYLEKHDAASSELEAIRAYLRRYGTD